MYTNSLHSFGRKDGTTIYHLIKNKMPDIEKTEELIIGIDDKTHQVIGADSSILRNKGIANVFSQMGLVRHGSPRNGYWEITQKYE